MEKINLKSGLIISDEMWLETLQRHSYRRRKRSPVSVTEKVGVSIVENYVISEREDRNSEQLESQRLGMNFAPGWKV